MRFLVALFSGGLTVRFGAVLCFAAPPAVIKVEPPSWVSPRQTTTLRLLVTGKNLNNGSVEGTFRSSKPIASANGDYLFADVTIPAKAKPGKYSLQLRARDGIAAVPFEITAPLSEKTHFQGFQPDDVIYLAMPDRFANGNLANDDPALSKGLYDRSKTRYYHGGDFAGISQRLPYLKSLGVTALWLTPIYDNVNHLNERERYDGQAITDYHGYGAVDYYGVEEHFGTLDEYCALIEDAHRLGIKVIQDQVANHTGPYHPWAENPPLPDWYNGTPANHLKETWQTWALLDPKADRSLVKGVLDGWFVDILPDLNQTNAEVAQYLIQNTQWWIGRTGIDAIRQDTVKYAPRPFWRDWMTAIHRDHPKVNVVGEIFDEDPAMPSFFQGGHTGWDGIDTKMDSVFDFPLYYAIRRVFANHKQPLELAQVLSHDSLYPNPSLLVTFFGNHDIDRFMNVPGVTKEDLARAFTFLFTVRGVPMIYYGDEIAMPGGNDPDNRRDFPGGWKEDLHNAFEAAGRTPEQSYVFDHLQRLLKLRAECEPLRRGNQQNVIETETTFAFNRTSGARRALVIVHQGNREETVRIPSELTTGLTPALDAPPMQTQADATTVRLPARFVAIYRN